MEHMTGHILLKFTDYAEDFLNGSLYMNTLHYFWHEYRDRAIKKYLSDHPGETRVPITALKEHVPQEDVFEGSVGIGNSPDEKLNEYSLTDTIYRAVGYQYCNVFCLYRLDYTAVKTPVGLAIHYDEPRMSQFGSKAIIVDDEQEFIRRVERAAKQQDISYLCGNVNYWKPRNAEIMLNKPSLLLESEEGIDINAAPYQSLIKRYKDCFQKLDIHKDEREWRVAIYRGVRETKAYRLEVGSLRDICHEVQASDTVKDIDRLFSAGKVKGGCAEGYYGNVSRKEMRQKFYELGDNKAQMLVTIG